jgi:hypothetical protein
MCVRLILGARPGQRQPHARTASRGNPGAGGGGGRRGRFEPRLAGAQPPTRGHGFKNGANTTHLSTHSTTLENVRARRESRARLWASIQ